MRVYRMADTCFGLETVHTAIHRQLRDYAVESPAELTIRTTEADIAKEQERFPEPMVPAYAESLAVCRRLSDALLDRDVLLFHGSAVAVDGEVYLFTAPSGTGKSELIRALAKEVRGNVYQVDASQLTPSGYKGLSLSAVLYSIAQERSRDTRAQCRTSLSLTLI